MVRIGSRLGVVAIIALAWLPQDAGAQTAGLPAVASDSGDVVPAPATPDPLTPKPQDDGPLLAPGAAATRPAMAAVADADPALAALLKSTTGSGGLGRGAAADWAALVAYYAESDGQPVWTGRQGLNARADAVIAELRRADDYGLRASSFDLPAALPVDASVEARAETEQRLSLAVLTYARHARGGRTDPPALSRMIDMRPRLFEPKSVLAAIAAAEEAGAYLRGLHPKHVEFQRLQRALAAERAAGAGQAQPGKSNAELVQRIVVNMERWRWMPEELGAFHVWDNVPEQITRVMDNGMVTLSEKIVVGKPNTPTPMFSANMQFVIFHPSWGVPDGIKSNELAPQLRRTSKDTGFFSFGGGPTASSVLARHKLRVSYNGREINPDSINWATADVRQYHFTQPPSGANVLGVVKFRFPNRFDVYMHDTPERHLFNGGTRAFSHGCMRVQNPIRLAEVLLAHDHGWGAEKVRGLVNHGGTSDVALQTPIPVHVTYFTASADENGKVHLYGDIYGQDGRVASALAGHAVHLAAQTSEGATPRAKSPRRVAQAARAGAPYNPFAGLFGN